MAHALTVAVVIIVVVLIAAALIGTYIDLAGRWP